MKTIQKIYNKSLESTFAKESTWEIENQQPHYIKLKHYGTIILEVQYKEDRPVIFKNSASSSDTRGINALLKILRLKEYKDTLKSFNEWCNDNPSLFASDAVPGTNKREKQGNLYIESSIRKSFLDDSEMPYTTHYRYDEDTKTFRYVDKESL